jgi:hypothetical protein
MATAPVPEHTKYTFWTNAINNWIVKNFSYPQGSPATIQTEVTYWNTLASAVGTNLSTSSGALIPAYLPVGYTAPVAQTTWNIVFALANNLETTFNTLYSDLHVHLSQANVYKAGTANAPGAYNVYGHQYAYYPRGLALDNMQKLLNQMYKWWELKQQYLKNNAQLAAIAPPNVIVPATVHELEDKKVNPPPHKISRTSSPLAYRLNYTGDDLNKFAYNSSGTPIGTSEWYSKVDAKTEYNLGYMYQDLANANQGFGSERKQTDVSQLYGFQFMYNPTAISYTMTSDNTIDWMAQGSGTNQDPALPMFGSGTVEFSLYLNRIIDMSALRTASGQVTEADTKSGYRRPLKEGEITAILNRGTEFDIEFLYRVLNGTPHKSPTMKSGQLTSDMGLILGIPIWVRFHDNLRYKVIVTSLGVNHVMFNRDMVPMLTEVQISCSRIPVIAWDDSATTKKLAASANSIYYNQTNNNQNANTP